MELEEDKKLEFKNRFLYFIKKNKLKVILLTFLFLLGISSVITFKFFKEKKNNLISEKYIQAGLYLAKGNKIDSGKVYEDILSSNNSFYSILALNAIIENNLEKDKNKIINYFKLVEDLNLSQDQKELIKFKKALYITENISLDEGKELLKKIIQSESKFKDLSKEILSK